MEETFEQILEKFSEDKRPLISHLEHKVGERMAIIAMQKSPGVGTLILLDRMEDAGPFVIFATAPNRKFPIVSLRQPPELCGIDEPQGLAELEFKRWLKNYTDNFSYSLQDAVDKLNLTALWLAAASNWENSPYRNQVTVKVTDAKQDQKYS